MIIREVIINVLSEPGYDTPKGLYEAHVIPKYYPYKVSIPNAKVSFPNLKDALEAYPKATVYYYPDYSLWYETKLGLPIEEALIQEREDQQK